MCDAILLVLYQRMIEVQLNDGGKKRLQSASTKYNINLRKAVFLHLHEEKEN